jgi:outer membrane protein assembly factor BamB
MKYVDDFSTDLTGKWTRFRGEKSDNIIVTSDNINFSDGDYPELWSKETGEGYAAPVIYNGRAYFLDYIEAQNSDALRCVSLETGEELWRRWYRVPMKRDHGFSRTVPAIGEGYIITIGPRGHVMCCDPVTGDLKWTLDMQKEFNSDIPKWHAGQCPLVDGNVVILAPAGDSILLAGFDCHTGEMLWSTPNTLNYKMSHSSVMPMTLNGKKTYVYLGFGGICGVSAEENDRGTLLWETSRWRPSTAAPSPVQVSANQIFACAGYGTGGAMLRIDRQGERWTATVVEQYLPNTGGLTCEQQTPILYDGMLISILPNDGGGNRRKLVCYLPSNLRTPIWTSAANERFGFGPFIVINNHVFVFSEDGNLSVYEIMKQNLKLVSHQHIMEGVDGWGPLAYADGVLIVTDAHTVKALKIVEN